MAFSPDGSKFVAMYQKVVYVYDVAALTRLGTYAPAYWSIAAWAPDGRHVLVSWDEGACLWDFSRLAAPSVVTINVGVDACFHSWSLSGASYFVLQKIERRVTRSGPRTTSATFALEERRAADGLLVRTIDLGPGEDLPKVFVSPDSHALLVYPFGGNNSRVVVFE